MASALFNRLVLGKEVPTLDSNPSVMSHKDAKGGLGGLIGSGKHVLWVASCGGHLAELKKMADLYSSKNVESTWVTFDTPQSRSMLNGLNVHYISRIGTRDAKGTLQALVAAYSILRGGTYDCVVSTGAAVAVSFLPLATMLGAEAIYIESLTRTQGASTTGKILRRFSAVRMFTQYESWSDSRWKFVGSVLDGWEMPLRPEGGANRLLVSLGTIRPYRFDRAVNAVISVLPEGCSVTWQLGATTRRDLPGEVHEEVGWEDMGRLIQEADIYVCHAGVGSVLQALDNGVMPVLAVRSAREGEHVDDHQSFFAQEIVRRGLGTVLDLSGNGPGSLQRAEEPVLIERMSSNGGIPVRRLPRGTELAPVLSRLAHRHPSRSRHREALERRPQ